MGVRAFIAAGALLLLGLGSSPVLAKEKVDPAALSAMVEKTKAKDPAADVRWLRQENSRRFSYMAPRWEDGRKAFETLEKNPEKALEVAAKQLAENPLDMDANLLTEIALSKLGRKDEEARQHNLLMALLESVMDGKDGQSPKTAWNAVSIDEEYQVLRLIGFEPKMQALVMEDGKRFDALTVTSSETGKELTLHFNIDFFFGKQFEGLGL